MSNDYDRYAAMRQEAFKKGESKPHRFVEKPAMKSLLTDLSGKKILMLGCGTGEESMLLREYGAADLVGVDLSSESIKLASSTYPEHDFQVADMHSLPFEDSSFDFVYSSLAVHYSSNPLSVYKEIARVLKPGGVLQFSVGHPMRWSSERVERDGHTTKLIGYDESSDPLSQRVYGDYSDFREYSETFPTGETLTFWVGPPSMHFGLLKEASFLIEDFIETRAIEETKEVDPNYYERFSKIPQFTIFVARKS